MTRFRFLSNSVFLLITCIARISMGDVGSAAAPSIIIENVNIIPLDADHVLWNQHVVVEDGSITRMGPQDELNRPSTGQIIDADGAYLIPGLTDAHIHLLDSRELTVYLANGVTTVRDLGGSDWHLNLLRELSTDTTAIPRLVVASAGVSDQMASVARQTVTASRLSGYPLIKMMSAPDSGTYLDFMSEARAQGMPVIGHIPRSIDLQTFITGNWQKEISHLEELIYAYTAHHGHDYGPAVIDLLTQTMLDNDISIVTTLVQFRSMIRQLESIDDQLHQPALETVSPFTHLSWTMDNYSMHLEPSLLPELRQQFDFLQRLVRALDEADVPLMLGTDSGVSAVVAGAAVHQELQLLVESGLSPYRALRMATRKLDPMGPMAAQPGRIGIGEPADLVMLAANPLDDITNTQRIEGVMMGGTWLAKSALQQRLAALQQAYLQERKFTELVMADGIEPALATITGPNIQSSHRLDLAAYEYLIRGFLSIGGGQVAQQLADTARDLYPENDLSHFLQGMVAEAVTAATVEAARP
ncbi:MAG: amidohydrolase family protein [Gemmatimonadetes bacterium]|nr:amidohydrolase family protein [Gemmatimonadota bacterium]MBT5141586.1 amidohydrolase family protein [Gemmatimonadota bacterium]MBT5590889.1 amidohydrolase family protein [Gemmatimonadota bacterium]MBT5965047.1 amidohydrolase family protein [Gemmatimonadota bacterium]MBT6626447.1 amidohydrolase family protein [Gemmatimonadota bacterium]